MCRNNTHGGRRCPADSSEARQARRLAERDRRKRAISPLANSEVNLEKISHLNVKQIRAKAEDLRKRVHASPPDGFTQEQHDAAMEQELTFFGKTLAQRAETLSRVRLNEIEDLLAKKQEELYGDLGKTSQEADEVHVQASEEFIEKVLPELEKQEAWGDRAIWQEPAKLIQGLELTEDQQKLYNNLQAAYTNMMEANAKYDEADILYEAYRSELYDTHLSKLTQSYQTVIAEIRPVGGEASFDTEKSQKDAVKLLQSTIDKVYPSAWLNEHNQAEGAQMRVTSSSARANYNHTTKTEELLEAPVPANDRNYYLNFNEPEEKVDKFMLKMAGSFPGSIPRMLTVKSYMGNEQRIIQWEQRQAEFYSPKSHGPFVDGKPEGEGWKYGSHIQTIFDPKTLEGVKQDDEEEMYQRMLAPRWYREEMTDKKFVPSLNFYDQEAAQETQVTTAEATAIHEFAHRVEKVLPNNILPRQERAFLLRRSAKTVDNEYSNMSRIAFRDEYAHDAGMVDAYMARDYGTKKSYEVFSTGIEALYGGVFGGLSGLNKSYQKSDPEHRGFVLGCLATL